MPIERDGAGRLGHTAQAPRKDRIGSGGGGGGGAGTVTDITAGTGLTATPNPIIGSGTIEIAATGVTAGFYGVDAATTVSFNVNAQGQLDLASETSIQIVESQVTGLAASLAALQPLDADLTQIAAIANVRGDLLYTDATPNWARLAIGTAAKYLRSDGTDPSWQTIAYADISGTPTSLPPSGSAGGDLSGSYPNPTVVDDSHAHTAATLPAIVYDGDAAGGDLSGTYPNPSVVDDSHAHTSATVTPAGIGAQPVDADLTALAALAATAGMLSRTGAGAFTARTLTAPAAGLTIADPTGAAGNPTFALANDLAALEGLGSTGIACRTAADTWAQRTITGGTGVTITNPGGVAGNIDVALALGSIDHNSLSNLATGDVHTQYTLRAGRAGSANDTVLSTTTGGILSGSSAASQDLTLQSTTNATKGYLILDDKIDLWPSIPSTNASLILMKADTAYTMPDPSGQLTYWQMSAAITSNNTIAPGVAAVDFAVTLTNTVTPVLYFLQVFKGTGISQSATNGVAPLLPDTFTDKLTMKQTSGSSTTAFAGVSLVAQQVYTVTGTNLSITGAFAGLNAGVYGMDFQPTFNGAGTVTVDNVCAVVMPDPTTGGGVKTLTAVGGLDVYALTKGATNFAVRSQIAAAAGRYFLKDDGGAQSKFAGKITTYNNIATDGVGMPSVVKIVDLTAQSAAGAAVALWTPAAAGLYRISFALTLTRAATTSSVLGGAAGIKVNYTTGDGATAKNQNVPCWIPGSTTATAISSATNTVGDTLIGSIVIYSSTTAVTYDCGYTSVGGTTMQYALRIRVEAL